MNTADIRSISFNTFSKGSYTKGNSLIKFLPVEILEIIQNNYVMNNFTFVEMVRYRLNKSFFNNFDITLINDDELYEIIEECCVIGNIDILIWLFENKKIYIKHNRLYLNLASKYGHLEVVKWLHENRNDGCSSHAMDHAASNGHIEVVKWLHENRTEGCTIWAMDLASKNGHIEVVKWLHENRTEGCTENAMDCLLYTSPSPRDRQKSRMPSSA